MGDRIYWNCRGCGRQWSCPNPTYWTPNTMHACLDGAMTSALMQGGPEALELAAATAETLDAARYRFLRDIAMTLDDVPSVVSGASGEFDFLKGAEVDEAVDEAMAEWRKQELL